MNTEAKEQVMNEPVEMHQGWLIHALFQARSDGAWIHRRQEQEGKANVQDETSVR